MAAELFDRVATARIGPKFEPLLDIVGPPEPEITGPPEPEFVDVLQIRDLRFQFRVNKGKGSDPNGMELKIFNLSKETIGKISATGQVVILEAGYQDLSNVIYIGDVVDNGIRHTRQGPDRITTIECGSGANSLANVKIVDTFDPNITIKDAFTKIAASLGESVGDIVDLLTDKLNNGLTVTGSAKDALDKLAQTSGVDWSIQDGKIVAINKNRAINSEAAAPLVSPGSGLIGSPTRTDKGVNFRSLMNGAIHIGTLIKIESELINGFYKVEKLTHEGDTRDTPWYTSGEAVIIQ